MSLSANKTTSCSFVVLSAFKTAAVDPEFEKLRCISSFSDIRTAPFLISFRLYEMEPKIVILWGVPSKFKALSSLKVDIE